MRQHLPTPIPIIFAVRIGRENGARRGLDRPLFFRNTQIPVPDIFFPGFSARGLFASKILLGLVTGVTIHCFEIALRVSCSILRCIKLTSYAGVVVLTRDRRRNPGDIPHGTRIFLLPLTQPIPVTVAFPSAICNIHFISVGIPFI